MIKNTKSKSSQVILPKLKTQHCHLAAVWMGTSYIPFLNLVSSPVKVIYSFDKYVVSIYHGSGTVAGNGDMS